MGCHPELHRVCSVEYQKGCIYFTTFYSNNQKVFQSFVVTHDKNAGGSCGSSSNFKLLLKNKGLNGAERM